VPETASAAEADGAVAEPLSEPAVPATDDAVAQAGPVEVAPAEVALAATADEDIQAAPGDPVEAPAATEAEKASEKAQRKATAEPRLDEIWRPRRQGRHQDRDRARRRFAGSGEPAKKDDAHPRRGGKEGRAPGDGRQKDGRQHKRPDRPDHRPEHRPDRPDRHDRRQGHGGGRRDERPQRQLRHSASPAPKAGVDPDSPFAALSSLKAALEQRGQE
jgi:ATP-dependent RNA helicase SUPV3L1/SUV3